MEIWSPIIGYEEFYLISDHGRARTLRPKFRKKEFLKGKVDNDGYLIYAFYGMDGKSRHMKAHRVVAIHFIPNPDSKDTVNHKDGNKLNNHKDNLEWATRQEQIAHAISNGLRRYRTGPFTEEHRRNLSIACMGRIPPNKGKKGLQVAWNKGLKFKSK